MKEFQVYLVPYFCRVGKFRSLLTKLSDIHNGNDVCLNIIKQQSFLLFHNFAYKYCILPQLKKNYRNKFLYFLIVYLTNKPSHLKQC